MSEVVEKEIIFSDVIETNIFDENLCIKVLDKIKEAELEIDPEYYYRLEVTFDLESYDNKERLFNFVIKNKKAWQKYDNEKNMIGLILSQQLEEINSNLEEIGFNFSSTIIKGDKINDLNIVLIRILKDNIKEYDKGNPKKIIKVHSIMPSVPYIKETIEETLIELMKKQMDEELEKQIKVKNHIPNFIKTDLLMKNIAKGIFLDTKYSKSKKEEEISIKKQDLLRTYKINSDFPLDISGNFDSDKNSNVEQVDCPNILIYKEYSDGFWSIKKIDYFKDVENEITKNGYCKNDVKDVVVLKDLKPLPFILINKEYVGMTIIKKKDANKYKKLEVCWK